MHINGKIFWRKSKDRNIGLPLIEEFDDMIIALKKWAKENPHDPAYLKRRIHLEFDPKMLKKLQNNKKVVDGRTP